MTKKSAAVPNTPIMFTTTAPPPVLSMSHIGRVSLTVTWPHVFGISEDIWKYRVTLLPTGVTADVIAPDYGNDKSYAFTGLAMDYPYTIEVRGVNHNSSGGEIVGPPGTINVRTLGEWSDPPATGIDGWTGTRYLGGKDSRTNFYYQHSGIFTEVDEWAKNAIVQGALTAPGGLTVDRQEGMTWIEFNTDKKPELLIRAILIRAGHRWPQ